MCKMRFHHFAVAAVLTFLSACNRTERELEKLHSGEPSDRAEAARELGDSRETRAIEPIIALLSDKNESVRKSAENALVKIGLPAVDLLGAHLNDKQLPDVVYPASVLGKISGARAFEWLLRTITDEKTGGMNLLEAISAINGCTNPRIIEPLMKCVSKVSNAFVEAEHKSDLRTIIEALRAPGSNAVEPLIGFLKDDDPWKRFAATEALGRIKDGRAVRSISANLKHKDAFVRRSSAQALGSLGVKDVVSDLESVLPDPGCAGEDIGALEALGWTPHSPAQWTYWRSTKGMEAELRQHWGEARETIINDARSGELRRMQFAVNFLAGRFSDAAETKLIMRRMFAEDDIPTVASDSARVKLCELFLNCGASQLHDFASDWASHHGLHVERIYLGTSR